MDVRLSPEQEALHDSAAQMVDRLGPHAVGALGDDERRSKLDAAIAASGWRELRTPDEGDAPLASAVEVALVAEQLGRGLADAPYLGPTLAAELRRLAGAPTATVLETVTLAPDLSALAGIAYGDDLEGGVSVVDAAGAAAAVTLLPGPGGPVLATVALLPGREEVDLTRAVAEVAPSRPEPVEGQRRPLRDADLRRWTALGLVLTSADLVGVMAGAVRLACDYAVERHQYGAAIGSFQAVQHLLADAHVATEGSRSATLHAAWAVDALPAGDALAAAAGAKAYCSRAARMVCETAIQVHGGIGNTWECLAHVYLRRALLTGDLLGGAGTNLARVLDLRRLATSTDLTGGVHGLR